MAGQLTDTTAKRNTDLIHIRKIILVQEAKESSASPDNLFHGKLHIRMAVKNPFCLHSTPQGDWKLPQDNQRVSSSVFSKITDYNSSWMII